MKKGIPDRADRGWKVNVGGCFEIFLSIVNAVSPFRELVFVDSSVTTNTSACYLSFVIFGAGNSVVLHVPYSRPYKLN